MSGVTVKHGCVTIADLPRMIQYDNLSGEILSATRRLVLGIAGNVATTQLLHGDILDVEADVVAGHSLSQGLVVHLHGLDFGGEGRRGEGHHHTGFQDTRFYTANRYGTDTTDLVDILEEKTHI